MTDDHAAHCRQHQPVLGFGADRAADYDAQASVSLAGVQAAYELGVSALAAQLDRKESASLLYVGFGTGAELVPYTRFGVPGWRFTGVDPSDAMLAMARKRLQAEGLLSRTQLHVGELHTLPAGSLFDGAQMLGVLHTFVSSGSLPTRQPRTRGAPGLNRMAEARRRLRGTDERVDIIAERVGYADVTHFIRLFRRAHGLTPAAWRRQAMLPARSPA